jgi:DUF4097 and DUF4098 domain-containing protein YvlB
MANGRPRGSSIFSGLMLLLIGSMLLLHNYRGFELSRALFHWWPLLLIFWGAIKLYERTIGTRSGEPGAARVTAGEVFLVIGLVALVGAVVGVDTVKSKFGDDDFGFNMGRESFSSDLDVAPSAVPADARITIHGGHGDISVRSSSEPEIRVNGKRNVRGWNESEALRTAERVSVEIVKNGDGYEVRPTGVDGSDSRVSVDMDVVVPTKSSVTVRNDKGDITISDMAKPVSINGLNGDIEVRNTAGDVSIDMRRGDVKVSGTKGDVKISGSGDSIDVVDATGNFTINGEFVGPIRAEKVAKGVRFVSRRTDLTLTQLSGHMEVGSGNLEVVDAPGNLNVRTHEEEVSIENASGKIKVDNRNGNVEVRFSSPPKEDVEIYNASAAITVGLPESSNFEISADCHSGDIDSEFEADSLKKTSSGSGDSHLEGKYGNGRGPKIILKTSYGSISIHKNS